MYRIIGSDGKEYGPVSAEQLRDWIKQGRVNASTQILEEGTTNWRPLSEFTEFIGPAAAAPGPASFSQPMAGGLAIPSQADALQKVSGPATGLIVTAILGFLTQATSLVMNVVGAGMSASQMNQMPPAWAAMFSGTVAIVSSIIGILFGVVVLIGAMKMKKLENHGFAMAASIIAAVPCVSPCCFIGLPIGIWAIVVLMKPEVKNAFH